MKLKLILPKITKDTPGSGEGEWIPWRWRGAFDAFLNAHDIWPDHDTSQLSYNPVYHFYDYTAFPSPKNLHDTPDLLGEAIVRLFSEWTKAAREGSTWRWAGRERKEKVVGARIWIEPYSQ